MSLKGINAYRKGNLKQDVANADPHKLTLMLLQGALDRIAYAKGAMERKELVIKAAAMRILMGRAIWVCEPVRRICLVW